MEDRVRSAGDDDVRLLQAWIDGDAEAGKTLVCRHYRNLFLFFYAKVGPDIGYELTQATFETLCAKKVDFRGDSNFATYLFGIARWKLVHHFRTRQCRGGRFEPLEDSLDLPEVDRSMTSLFMGRQREALVVRALRSLPLDDQIILALKVYEGMTVREIAAVYGVGRETMSSRINRARARLAEEVTRLAPSTAMLESTMPCLDECLNQIRQGIAAVVDE